VYEVIALPPLSAGVAHVVEIVEDATVAASCVGIPGRLGIFALAKTVPKEEPMLLVALMVNSYSTPLERPVITAVVLAGAAVTVATPDAVIE
jgi:hypothetical protein